MLKLYGMAPVDRSGRVRWMLLECGVPFEDRWLKWREGDLDAPAFRAISPFGKVPAIETDDGLALCETSVILDWIGRTYGQGALNPAAHDAHRYRSWMALASSTIDPICFEFVRPDVPKDDRPARRAQALRDMNRSVFTALRETLADRGSILPAGFCAVDIQVAASLHYADSDGRLADEPRLKDWLSEMRERPAAVASKLFS
ncbi:MAG: glutathione S-transferase family protein [Alphaproteobacteria bacterium]|nr:glutathione S-transferase family protein [Alphaproteobacteria bacterium]